MKNPRDPRVLRDMCSLLSIQWARLVFDQRTRPRTDQDVVGVYYHTFRRNNERKGARCGCDFIANRHDCTYEVNKHANDGDKSQRL